MGVSKDEKNIQGIVSRLRWYPNKAGAIIIVKRGADRKVLATISPKSGRFAHLYPSWQKALAELETAKAQKGVSRMSHEGLATGEIPLAKDY